MLRAFRLSGPVSAVAELAGVPDVSDRLRAADAALSAGDHIAAVDAAAIALDSALRRTCPALRPWRSRFLHAGMAPRVRGQRTPELQAIDETQRYLEG